jgi:hypothetical protein
MFDKLFVQDERVLLHHWDLLHARFMILARAGQMVMRGAWELARVRDVLANAAHELASVERELARFRATPVATLPPEAADLWRAAADWVTALREWTVPPETWTADQLAAALARRQGLETRFLNAVAAFPFGAEESEPLVADPMVTRGG